MDFSSCWLSALFSSCNQRMMGDQIGQPDKERNLIHSFCCLHCPHFTSLNLVGKWLVPVFGPVLVFGCAEGSKWPDFTRQSVYLFDGCRRSSVQIQSLDSSFKFWVWFLLFLVWNFFFFHHFPGDKLLSYLILSFPLV